MDGSRNVLDARDGSGVSADLNHVNLPRQLWLAPAKVTVAPSTVGT